MATLIPAEELTALGARYLGVPVPEVALRRLEGGSFTNYVYRAQAPGRSIILKASDNIASRTRTPLDPAHLELEFLLLDAIAHLKQEHVLTPAPIAYDARWNVLVMSDLGEGTGPLCDLTDRELPEAAALRHVGTFLRLIHGAPCPPPLDALLRRTRVAQTSSQFKLAAFARYQEDWSPDEPLLHPRWPGLSILDFTPQNCLLLGSRVGVFDFEFLAYADQLLDLANFQARLLFMAVLGKISRSREDLLDGLLLGYFGGGPSPLEEDVEAWRAFCRYLTALLFFRFNRDCSSELALAHLPLLRRIYAGACRSWVELREHFFAGLRPDLAVE